MKKIFSILAFLLFCLLAKSQEYFTIKNYDVNVKVNQDASLDITENIQVEFTEPRHGIFRMIPYKYQLQQLPAGTEKADRQMESSGYTKTLIKNIEVDDWKYETSTQGDYIEIKIGDPDNEVDGLQRYVIHYRILNAINFFKDHSELYFNLIGDQWPVEIDSVHFNIELYKGLSSQPSFFVATGATGSTENATTTSWSSDNKIFSGSTTRILQSKEGVTAGIIMPQGFLNKPNYSMLGIKWLLLVPFIFIIMFLVWRKWGKDDDVTITTEFYPPKEVSPSVAGYVIDETLDRRDLTALIPYWGAGGYLQINEIENKALFGLMKNKEYEFIKLKELPASAMSFEKTLFNGIFESGDRVLLSSLQNKLYVSMSKAKQQLEAEVNKEQYFTKGSRGAGCLLFGLSFIPFLWGAYHVYKEWGGPQWYSLAFIACGIIIFCFAIYMPKKTKKGTELYQKLAGFKEFIQMVEQPRLQQFLKDDPNYFDTVLPYAIIFNVADKWKDKLKDLDVPPPTWYHGAYGSNFSTYMFMNSLDHSMNQMSQTFYSTPSSSGSSGGSFSGGGGFSGGGFGGGGGGSW